MLEFNQICTESRVERAEYAGSRFIRQFKAEGLKTVPQDARNQTFTCLVRVNFSVKASELKRTKRLFPKKIIAANPFCRVIAHNIDDGELSGRVSCFLSVTGHFSFNFCVHVRY